MMEFTTICHFRAQEPQPSEPQPLAREPLTVPLRQPCGEVQVALAIARRALRLSQRESRQEPLALPVNGGSRCAGPVLAPERRCVTGAGGPSAALQQTVKVFWSCRPAERTTRAQRLACQEPPCSCGGSVLPSTSAFCSGPGFALQRDAADAGSRAARRRLVAVVAVAADAADAAAISAACFLTLMIVRDGFFTCAGPRA